MAKKMKGDGGRTGLYTALKSKLKMDTSKRQMNSYDNHRMAAESKHPAKKK